MEKTVAIVGGGIAGLTAAHELIERGFTVHVYERRTFFGGKAASYRKRPVNCVDDREVGLPGEHGFRFFPGWYSHLTDTMARIPYHRPGGGRRTVADNLVSVEANVLAWFDRAPLALPLQVPRSAAEALVASQFVAEFGRLGLTSGEVAFFFRKLLEMVVLSDDRRVEAFEGVSWWDFLDSARQGRSRAFQDLVRAATRTSVAAKAEQVSAYTIGRLVIRSLLDTVSTVDRVLNGPTSEVWIKPWIDHLKARGVIFHEEMELQAIKFDGTSRKVKGLVMEPVAVANVRRLRRLIARELGDDVTLGPKSADEKPLSEDTVDEVEALLRDLNESSWLSSVANLEQESAGAACGKELCDAIREACTALTTTLEKTRSIGPSSLADVVDLEPLLARLESDPRHCPEVVSSFFVLAVPLEQLAYYVNRTTMLTFLAPEFRKVVRLSRQMDWMAGIQFYLRTPLDIASGHLVGVDSPWALTAVEHTQFWKDISLPSGVRAILSVDISAWDKRGRFTRKEAYNCSDQEIADEVWGELKEMLNKLDGVKVLRDDMLVGGILQKGESYHLDESIVDLRDRKKQGFYERARGLQFNTLDAADDDGDDLNAGGCVKGAAKDDSDYVWGPRRRFNAEPLLVNRAGSRRLRPEACTSIPNLFLAGDFVKTDTDLACMEGANEAARLAVNGILAASASREPRCQLWPFAPSRQALEAMVSATPVLRAVRGAATAAGQLQDRFWSSLAGGLTRVTNAVGVQRSRLRNDNNPRE